MADDGAIINRALLKVGRIGKYQIHVLMWSWVACALTSMQSLIITFTQADMQYRCTDDDLLLPHSNNSLLPHSNNSLLNETIQDQCKIGNKSCTTFEYTSDVYDSTVMSTFNLVCDRVYLSTIVTMLFMATRLPGGFIVGQSVDRLGRKKTLMVGNLLLGLFGIASAYSVNMTMYIIFRSIISVPIMAVYDSSSALINEVTTPTKRPHMSISLVFSWAFGIMALSGIGYWIRDWRDFQMAISLPSFVMFIISYWIYDESPHWLYSQGRCKEAQLVIDKIAEWNKCDKENILTTPTEHNSKLDILENVVAEEHNSKEVLTPNEPHKTPEGEWAKVFKSRRFLATIAICVYGWFATSMGYAGLAFGLSSLAGDVYIVNLIGGGTEIVSYCIAYLIIPGGRKKISIGFLLVGGSGLIAAAVIRDRNPNLTWLIILMTMMGRLSVSACWQIMYLWCMELFPTTVRVTLLELSMILGHIGSTAAPFINDVPKLISNKSIRGELIAPALYGVCLVVMALLSLALPETNNRPLPLNVSEATSYTTRNRRQPEDSDENCKEIFSTKL